MDYCTLDDVVSYIQNIDIDTSTKPTADEVRGWIEDVSVNLVDPVLSIYGAVPITSVSGRGFLKMIVAQRVAAMILMSLEAEPEKARMYLSEYNNGMTTIQKNPGIVTGAAKPFGSVSTSFETRVPKYNREDQDW